MPEGHGCTDRECTVRIGKLLNVEKMIVGTVSKLGSKFFINITVVDVESGIIESAYDDKADKLEDTRETTQKIGKKDIDWKRTG